MECPGSIELASGMSWRVGKGDSIRVFHDQWIPRFNDKFINSLGYIQDSATMAKLVKDGRWDEEKIEQSLLWKLELFNKALLAKQVWRSIKLKQKLDKPILKIVSFVIFSLLVVGLGVAVVQGVDVNKYCSWCQSIDCIPLKWWSCNGKTTSCETMVSPEQVTLTCSNNGNFRVLPFTNVSRARIEDLCDLVRY